MSMIWQFEAHEAVTVDRTRPTTTAPQGYTTTDEAGNVLGCATAGSMVVPGGNTAKTCDVEMSTISAAPLVTSVGQIRQSWDNLNDCGQNVMGDGGKDTTPCHLAYQKFDAGKYYNTTAFGYIYHENGWGTSYGCKASFACDFDMMQDWLYPGEDILKAFDELWEDLGPNARCGYAKTHSGCSLELYPCMGNRYGKDCKDQEYSVSADDWDQ
ncbi:hypothetical protein P170DRAFT_479705 [Aspergillus steynii IBT 23096]|uniref:Uncharacterized protein n=1 Tax=Aspergillus steynii IBT 23096 TaxID=1392250 RepID=A0A2I2FX51_9EURO|nr:uncharacterized protein P170DRAFT_479705 [Aspergillus steynii IBT 23096]PLB45183.1 hypothetical protein P170DRAFT_479705 [Aspergillus steynii IBT 23096]